MLARVPELLRLRLVEILGHQRRAVERSIAATLISKLRVGLIWAGSSAMATSTFEARALPPISSVSTSRSEKLAARAMLVDLLSSLLQPLLARLELDVGLLFSIYSRRESIVEVAFYLAFLHRRDG